MTNPALLFGAMTLGFAFLSFVRLISKAPIAIDRDCSGAIHGYHGVSLVCGNRATCGSGMQR